MSKTSTTTTKATDNVEISSDSSTAATWTETIKTTSMTTTNNHTTAKPYSGRDFHRWRDHCYFLSRFTYPWVTGPRRKFNPCQSRHMKISEIQNIYERHAIVHFLRHYNESVWLGATHRGGWFWLNGEKITQGHFAAVDSHSDGKCLVLKGNHYMGEDCDRHFAHLCKKQI
ncbi:killer cell lectin-like receptor subfamily B member 1B allele C [Mytilus trossulus]|uniref:killer cell lectin-like receptor subfamily B member 1B allele C n=1 Tax=Mytilus trossulus TaxID=6551 RepID=UPI003004B20E